MTDEPYTKPQRELLISTFTTSELVSELRKRERYPNSSELNEMAHIEWENRQSRKGLHDEVAWCSGWISGYLTGRGEKPSDKTDMVQLYKDAANLHAFHRDRRRR